MIEIHQLSVSKDDKTICSVPDLRVASGERVAILGANGSGKTTLLRVLAGLEKDYVGRCVVQSPVRDRVYVHQAPYLFRGTTISNVTYGFRAAGHSAVQCERAARAWLERLGMSDLATSRVNHLSGGERRRVALARAMILHPRLLLLDEPFADMDGQGAAAVSEALNELPQTTVLIASPTKLPNGLAVTSIELSRDCVMREAEKKLALRR